jgi:hypothetical protein
VYDGEPKGNAALASQDWRNAIRDVDAAFQDDADAGNLVEKLLKLYLSILRLVASYIGDFLRGAACT